METLFRAFVSPLVVCCRHSPSNTHIESIVFSFCPRPDIVMRNSRFNSMLPSTGAPHRGGSLRTGPVGTIHHRPDVVYVHVVRDIPFFVIVVGIRICRVLFA